MRTRGVETRKRDGAQQAATLAREVMAEIASEREVMRREDPVARKRRERNELRRLRMAPLLVSAFLVLLAANLLAPRWLGFERVNVEEIYWELREEMGVAVEEVETFARERGDLPASLRALGEQYDERWTYEVLGGDRFRITVTEGDVEVVHDAAGRVPAPVGEKLEMK